MAGGDVPEFDGCLPTGGGQCPAIRGEDWIAVLAREFRQLPVGPLRLVVDPEVPGDGRGVVLAPRVLDTLLVLVGQKSAVRAFHRGFGWGAVTVVLFFILLSLLVFRRGSDNRPAMSLGQIIALELLPFWILALLSIFNGIDIERAFDGQDGGVIGWGMAYIFTAILPMGLAAVLLAILAVVCLYKGFGIDLLIRKWLADWESKNPQSAPVDLAVESDQPEQHTGKTSRPRHASDPSGEPVQAALFRRDERLPPTNLLMQDQTAHPDQEHIHETAVQIEQTLSEFGVPARVVGYRVGPTVTQYAVEPGFIDKPAADGSVQKQKVRVNQISTLSRDLALALSAERLRIEAPVPGRSYVGIEVPNLHSSAVRLRAVIESEQFQHLGSPLSIALGRDVSGLPVVGDLSRMPHILIAGTTGSGKSVCIAALTACLVMNNTPDDLRLAMLDPKMVELVRFNGLPHLLGKVETDIQRMLGVLRWALQEMDHRYRLLEEAHTRDLENYNRKMQRKKQPILPRIVVLIDELADLMMSAPDQTEHSLVRLAQMA
ncbi:MAG: DNA translocase FtsK, partial [Anaerolineaceae bacterium]|nr:DNA translocase FtsK [Anaerolineaceae bacterium]